MFFSGGATGTVYVQQSRYVRINALAIYKIIIKYVTLKTHSTKLYQTAGVTTEGLGTEFPMLRR